MSHHHGAQPVRLWNNSAILSWYEEMASSERRRKVRGNGRIESMLLLRIALLAAAVLLELTHGFGRLEPQHQRKRSVTRRRLDPEALRVLSTPEALVPESNPDFDPAAQSLSGVSYSRVLSGLHQLFPPQELEQRNAQSRKDGYWPYIQNGQDPPRSLTYGEFDFYFFAQLLDRARQHMIHEGSGMTPLDQAATTTAWQDKVFVDMGSGTGRLVLAAAALHPTWRMCRGIELLPTIHAQAETNLNVCRCSGDDMSSEGSGLALPTTTPGNDERLPLAPIELVCGSMDDPYVYYGDADLIFVFSSCMTPDLLSKLSEAIGRQCRPGTLVITTEYMLPLTGTVHPILNDDRFPSGSYSLGLVEQVDGWCWLTGGMSTAFIHRVDTSLWNPNQSPLVPPIQSVQDKAFEVAMALERGELTDSQRFLRNVHNNMVFHGFPTSFLPKLL